MDNLESNQFIVVLVDTRNKKQTRVSFVPNKHRYKLLSLCGILNRTFVCYLRYTIFWSIEKTSKSFHSSQYPETVYPSPLYSKKLHILTRRAKTNWVASLMIFAFSFGGMVMNHFVRRTLPWRLTKSIQFIFQSIRVRIWWNFCRSRWCLPPLYLCSCCCCRSWLSPFGRLGSFNH